MDRKQADEQLIVQTREQLIGWLMQLRPPLYCRLKIDGSYFFPDEKKVIMKVYNALTLELEPSTALTLVKSSIGLVMREQLKVQVRDQIIVQVRDQIIVWLMQLRPPLHSRLKIGDDILTGREKNVIIEVCDRLHTRLDEETVSEIVESSTRLVMKFTQQIRMFAKDYYERARKDDDGIPINYDKGLNDTEVEMLTMILETNLISEKVTGQCFLQIPYVFQYYVKKLIDAAKYETEVDKLRKQLIKFRPSLTDDPLLTKGENTILNDMILKLSGHDRVKKLKLYASLVALKNDMRERMEDFVWESRLPHSSGSFMDHLEELPTAAPAAQKQSYMEYLEELHRADADQEDIIAARAALAAQKHEDKQRVKRMINRHKARTNFCDLRLKMRM